MRYPVLFLVASAIGFCAAVFLAGCNGEISPVGESAAAASVPMLSFSADWSITASGPLVGGSPATIHYDLARLPRCRAVYHGGPAWGIVADWAADGGFARSAPL